MNYPVMAAIQAVKIEPLIQCQQCLSPSLILAKLKTTVDKTIQTADMALYIGLATQRVTRYLQKVISLMEEKVLILDNHNKLSNLKFHDFQKASKHFLGIITFIGT